MATATIARVATATIPVLPACNHVVFLKRTVSVVRFASPRVGALGMFKDLANPRSLSRPSLWSPTSSALRWSVSTECRGAGAFKIKSSESVEAEAVSESVDGNGSTGNGDGGGGGNGGGGEAVGWISSALVFAFFGAIIYYIAVLAPAQTPYRDQYFIEKLVGFRSDDGFVINTVLFCEFYIMGLWPVVYSCLLLPSARNRKGAVPAWPFLVLSFGAGAYALLPYFGLWQPPPPKVTIEELKKFPLNVLENKLVAYAALLLGVGLGITAALAGGEQWTEMVQYVRESKFIHVMSIDFLTFTTLAPFWVYNDMATRRWLDKGSWLLPLALVPYFGPVLYLILRPPLPLSMVVDDSEP